MLACFLPSEADINAFPAGRFTEDEVEEVGERSALCDAAEENESVLMLLRPTGISSFTIL